ncbi:MAG: hypothetical protein PHW51_02080 [Candidatus Omnitrophica bacterium]|nr:hypothetical protein [Candidatus Omnitrophota bacterium]MDD5539949.1 hypothetical protein [Candidatus Neomarinimicrobiota bacterium]
MTRKIGAHNEYGKLNEVIVGKVEDDAVMFGDLPPIPILDVQKKVDFMNDVTQNIFKRLNS